MLYNSTNSCSLNIIPQSNFLNRPMCHKACQYRLPKTCVANRTLRLFCVNFRQLPHDLLFWNPAETNIPIIVYAHKTLRRRDQHSESTSKSMPPISTISTCTDSIPLNKRYVDARARKCRYFGIDGKNFNSVADISEMRLRIVRAYSIYLSFRYRNKTNYKIKEQSKSVRLLGLLSLLLRGCEGLLGW